MFTSSRGRRGEHTLVDAAVCARLNLVTWLSVLVKLLASHAFSLVNESRHLGCSRIAERCFVDGLVLDDVNVSEWFGLLVQASSPHTYL